MLLCGVGGDPRPSAVDRVLPYLSDPDGLVRAFAWDVVQKRETLPPGLQFDPEAAAGKRASQANAIRIWRERSVSRRGPQ